MSEAIGAYTPERFPYYEILDELTASVQAVGMTPVQAYKEFLDERDAFELTPYFDYVSTSKFTGGHARIPGKCQEEIVAANTETARDIVAVLDAEGVVEASEILLPADLGNTDWSQSRYMLFCSLVIAGRDIRGLRSGLTPLTTFENKLDRCMREAGVRIDIMDSALDSEVRRPEYSKFVRAFAGLMRDIDLPGIPAHRLISLVDTRSSLECTAERVLADELSIPRQQVVATGPALNPEDTLPLDRLRQDAEAISAHGGHIMLAQFEASLMLTRDGEPVVSW
jgi:hypothetical protein